MLINIYKAADKATDDELMGMYMIVHGKHRAEKTYLQQVSRWLKNSKVHTPLTVFGYLDNVGQRRYYGLLKVHYREELVKRGLWGDKVNAYIKESNEPKPKTLNFAIDEIVKPESRMVVIVSKQVAVNMPWSDRKTYTDEQKSRYKRGIFDEFKLHDVIALGVETLK